MLRLITGTIITNNKHNVIEPLYRAPNAQEQVYARPSQYSKYIAYKFIEADVLKLALDILSDRSVSHG